jgi:uncharacterized NAD-dependent epimerase/dehydratase family protein
MTNEEQLTRLELKAPYLIFLGTEPEKKHAKTGAGIAHWRPDLCVGQLRLPGCGVDLGLPDMTPAEAAAAGARSFVWGVAGFGGIIPPEWTSNLFDAVEAGLDIVAGTHSSLADVPGLADAAEKASVSLIDVRKPPASIPVGSGAKRSGRRLLTVGTECAVGKKYTALAIAKEMTSRGIDADFRASGQTGIMIAGSGIPIDAVISDFISGAAEALSPANDADHWDIIEGQGSLFHPAYAAVTLGLMHGSQPDVFIVCHDVSRQFVDGYPDFPLPDFQTLIDQTIEVGKLTNANIRCAGFSVNTSSMGDDERHEYLQKISAEMGLPCVDAVATGVGPIVDHLAETFK